MCLCARLFLCTSYQTHPFFHQHCTRRQSYRGLISDCFSIDSFPDNCLFSCIASALALDGAVFSEDEPFCSENVRGIVADYILDKKGEIYNHRTKKYEGPFPPEKYTKHVRKPRKQTALFVSCICRHSAFAMVVL